MVINGDMIKGFEFKKFATPRIIGGIVIVVIVLWALVALFGSPHDKPANQAAAPSYDMSPTGRAAEEADQGAATTEATGPDTTAPQTVDHEAATAAGDSSGHGTAAAPEVSAPAAPSGHTAESTAAAPESAHSASNASPSGSTADLSHGSAPAATGHALPGTAMTAPVRKPPPRGVTFVDASMKPLSYELEERWWGWRPNDIINVTDNVENYQLGVLEVTRRVIVALAERISRTGTTDAYDENLEAAMNWFMVKASSYWFPSAESKYRDGLEEMQIYREKLMEGKARFYTRADNLIPLLASFEDLLGSCDENLVKQVSDDGEPISFFNVDDYFFYAQGVAGAMATVLEAVHHDFLITLESRNATDLLHHAILACQRASAINPWIILDPELDSTFANHRANMAAPISHARFYIGQLIKTLST